MITRYHAKYYASLLSRHAVGDGLDSLSQSLLSSTVDINPHQIDAALFAFKSPFSKGVVLADEVGLGKTIEAGLVLCQYWSVGKKKIIIVCPASLRKALPRPSARYTAAWREFPSARRRLRSAPWFRKSPCPLNKWSF